MAEYNENRARQNAQRVNDWRIKNQGGGYSPWVGRQLSESEWAEVNRYNNTGRRYKTTTSESMASDIGEIIARFCCCTALPVVIISLIVLAIFIFG